MEEQAAVEKMRNVMLRKHLAMSTIRTYGSILRRYCRFLRSVPAKWSSERKIEAFLSRMAKDRYSASTQNQAFNAVLFFYRNVLKQELHEINALRAKRPTFVREAAEPDQVRAFLDAVSDGSGYPMRLMTHLLYECGLRKSEVLRIRLKDIKPDAQRLTIRQSKGGKDRVVRLPCSLVFAVKRQIKVARGVWDTDRHNGMPVPLPWRMHRKHPQACYAEAWAWLFPAHKTCEYPANSGKQYRWHVHESTLGKAITAAAKKSNLEGVISAHVLRHSYATHVIAKGASIRDVQQALGHKHLDTTMIYVHPDALNVMSPLEGACV